MARTIKEAWADYKRHYASGFESLAKKEIPVYDGAVSRHKVGTIRKGTPVHVKPLTGDNYVPKIEVIYNGDKHGWILTTALGKPGQGAKGKKKNCPMKPQDFEGIAGIRIGFSAYYRKVLNAIDRRDDLPMVLKTYLKELTEYCMHHGPAARRELTEAYAELSKSEYISCMSDIEKDFSEITAPLCVLERGSGELAKLGFPNLNKATSEVFIPTEGNFALVDFMLYDKDDREYQFSVKKISKTTNVVKPQDIINLLDQSKSSARWVKDYKKTFEYKLLKVLADNNVRMGSFKALELCCTEGRIKAHIPAEVVNNIQKMIKDGDPGETDIEVVHDLWWKLAEVFYNEAIDYWTAPKHSSGIVGIAALICQIMLRKLSADKKLITFRDIMTEFVMREVVYYKFAAPGGIPNFYMENHLSNNLKPTDNFYLREKSTIGNPYRDKVGVQP